MQETDNRNIAFQKLSEYFNLNGWPMYVDETKLQNRLTIIKVPYKKDWIIAEFKEKRSIVGEMYFNDIYLRNYKIYAIRFAIDLISGKVEKLEERQLDRIVDLDALVHERIPSHYSVKVSTSRKPKVIHVRCGRNESFTSLSEAKSEILKMVSELDFGETFKELTKQEENTLREKLFNRLYNKAFERWTS